MEADDDGTGMLRLTYTAPADGIADSAGNALPDIALTSMDQGNVREETGAPAIFAARTIGSTQIELSFSEPVVTSNAAQIAGAFKIGNQGFAINANIFVTSGSITSSAYIFSSQTQVGTNFSLTSQGMKGTLTVPAAIPASWDGGTGHIRLTYNGAGLPERIMDATPKDLLNFGPVAMGTDLGIVKDNL